MLRISSVLLSLGAVAAIAMTVAPLGATPPAGPAALPEPAAVVMDDDEEDGGPCQRTEFKTKLLKDACAKGGQTEAKRVMKRLVKNAKRKLDVGEVTCKTCHEVLAPEYTLKDDALARFEDWQKQLAAKDAAPSE